MFSFLPYTSFSVSKAHLSYLTSVASKNESSIPDLCKMSWSSADDTADRHKIKVHWYDTQVNIH